MLLIGKTPFQDDQLFNACCEAANTEKSKSSGWNNSQISYNYGYALVGGDEDEDSSSYPNSEPTNTGILQGDSKEDGPPFRPFVRKVAHEDHRPSLNDLSNLPSDLTDLIAKCWQSKAEVRPDMKSVNKTLRAIRGKAIYNVKSGIKK